MFDTCVFGGTGFIGKRLLRLLENTGRRVVVVVRPGASRGILYGAEFVELDIRGHHDLRRALGSVGEVIDLAYTAGIGVSSLEDPCSMIRKNIDLSVRIAEIALSLGPRRYIYFSSGGTVYGEAFNSPTSENEPLRPISTYGVIKGTVENLLLHLHRTNKLPLIVLRPSNAYGFGQDPDRGQGFIGVSIDRILKNLIIPVYGKFGTVRDYIHVDDVAHGVLAALERGVAGEAYNISSGIGVTNKDILDMLTSMASEFDLPTPRVEVLPNRSSDVRVSVLDNMKARTRLGWDPAISLNQGLRMTLIHAIKSSDWNLRKQSHN